MFLNDFLKKTFPNKEACEKFQESIGSFVLKELKTNTPMFWCRVCVGYIDEDKAEVLSTQGKDKITFKCPFCSVIQVSPRQIF